ncbi:MAG: NADH-quinone oxidoreductase subunit L [Candidatus Bathyarchaeia archaeon]|jgi:NADH-quinone oxidoreductase subunit L
MSFDITEFSAWAVWILPLTACLFVPVVAKKGDKIRNYFVIGIMAAVAGLAFSLIPGVWFGNGTAVTHTIPWISSNISAGVYIDPLSVLFVCLVAFFGLIIAVYSWGYMKGEEGLTRYYFLIMLFIGSMAGLVISDNLLQMFIFWEMVGLCSYALIAFWYKRPESVNAGVKVFIMTRIGDISLLAAIGILYAGPIINGQAPLYTFSFTGIITALTNNAHTLNTGLLTIVFFLVLGGAIAKSAQLPLFTWLYSAMEAPTSVSALLHAATMVKAGIYLLARFILIASVAAPLITALDPLWFPTVAWIGVLTAFVGATLAITTTDIKGVLAYSTVSQIGFMMAGLGAAVAGAASIGWFGSLFHMVSHAFFEGLGFLIAGGIIHAIGTRDMRLMGGLRKLMPTSFILMGIMIITTSGLPPFASFFSKGLIISSVTTISPVSLANASTIQAIILYITAAITFAYCIRMFSLVFMGKESDHLKKQHVHESSKVMLIPAAILTGLCCIWGLSMPVILDFMSKSTTTAHLTTLGISLLGSFTDIETPIFLSILVPTFILLYFSYYRNFQGARNIGGGSNPIATMLKHAYFFDDAYRGIAKGIGKLSVGVKFIEDSANKLSVSFAYGTERAANRLKKVPSTTVQNYIAASVVGFILIVVLLVLTVGV